MSNQNQNTQLEDHEELESNFVVSKELLEKPLQFLIEDMVYKTRVLDRYICGVEVESRETGYFEQDWINAVTDLIQMSIELTSLARALDAKWKADRDQLKKAS